MEIKNRVIDNDGEYTGQFISLINGKISIKNVNNIQINDISI